MKTAIEKMYDILKGLPKGTPISIKSVGIKAECSMAHVSQTFKMAEYIGILSRDIEGNIFVKKLPKKRSVFVAKISEESGKYRERVKGTGTPRTRKIGRRMVPEDFEINVDTISAVVEKIVHENEKMKEKIKELKDKNKKLRKYIIKKTGPPKKKKKKPDFYPEEEFD